MRYFTRLKRLLDIRTYKLLYKQIRGFETKIFLIAILKVIGSILGVSVAIITKLLIDSAVEQTLNRIIIYSICLGGLLLLDITSESVTSYYLTKATEEIRNSLQLRLLQLIYDKKWLYIGNFKSGDLLTRLQSDVGNIVHVATDILPSLFGLILQVTLAFGFLALYDPFIAVLAILVMPLTILAGMIIGRALRRISMQIQETEGNQQAIINESIHNLLILKVFEQQKVIASQVNDIQKKKLSLIKERNIISIKANILMNIGYGFGFFTALAIGSYRLYTRSISFGTLAAFMQLVGQVQGPIQEMAHKIPQLISSFSSLDRIIEIQELPGETRNQQVLGDKLESISIHNVTFGYDEHHDVFSSFSMDFNFGERIGVIGESGRGKTTMLHILLSLLEVREGEVIYSFVDGTRVSSCPEVRSLFSYVPQSTLLFSGTIRDNLLVNKNMKDERIYEILDVACAKDFVCDLPAGLDTVLNEGGAGLSQGQTQRLSIARALLQDTQVLIFDEATSALDMHTEVRLIENLRNFFPNKTLIAVTHREEILNICDRIIEI